MHMPCLNWVFAHLGGVHQLRILVTRGLFSIQIPYKSDATTLGLPPGINNQYKPFEIDQSGKYIERIDYGRAATFMTATG
jgi:hypothetical protein